MRVLASIVVLAALAASGASANVQGVRTIFVTPEAIGGAAQDGRTIVWFSPCEGVRVRVLATGRDLGTGERRAGPCEDKIEALAVGGGRVLWIESSYGNSTYSHVTSAVPGEPHARYHGAVIGDGAVSSGDYLTGAAGDGSLLVYSVITRFTSDGCLFPDETPEPCEFGVSGGRLIRVVGRKGVRVPGVPPAALLAAGAGRVAIVTVARLAPGDELDQTGVEVRDGFTGQLVRRVIPNGEVQDLALSRATLALLVRRGGALWLDRYALPEGRFLGATRVFGNATELSVAGTRVVFRTDRAIRLLDARSGRTRVVARPPRPGWVSIEDRRVIWVDGRRVRAVDV